jgi:hypothetical protein
MFWPDGVDADLHLKGRARDLRTPSSGTPVQLATADLYAVSARDRQILRMEADPSPAGLERLVGCRAGSNLRKAIVQELPEQVAEGTPLYLLLDDLAGATLIAGFTFIRWMDVLPGLRERMQSGQSTHVMRDVCSGFRDGASSIKPDGTMSYIPQNTAHTGPLADAADPLGWHELDDPPQIGMRRARRIDVWAEGDRLGIDAMFRDSCWDPDGRESVIHEYQILGTADRTTGILASVEAVPRVLPYVECPMAAPNAAWLTGSELGELRREVVERLRNADCCTHLNDALRALAEVPVLATALA